MKKYFLTLQKLLPNEIWTFLALTLLTVFVIIRFCNLVPQVDENFFFSSDDPQFQTEERISQLFLRNDSQLIISATGDINAQSYFQEIITLTTSLKTIKGVSNVKSISDGPHDLKDAKSSPLWKRLLISSDQKSTNLIILLDEANSKNIVLTIEEIINRSSHTGFKLRISGLPYVVELISRYLLRDLKTFSLLAFLLFGCVIYLTFRSKSIVIGTMITCINACMWTFMLTNLLHISIGILTANLATIIFVLTLSHIVFLTYNWKRIGRLKSEQNVVNEAVAFTFEASFWSMLTTLLGFLSLLFVPAKPLRELGISGAVGSIVAILAAYGVYPAFLRMSHAIAQESESNPPLKRIFSFLEHHQQAVRLLIISFCILVAAGLFKINSDPSMLSFFSKKSEIYQGLEYIDKNGGSSPLVFVVKSNDGALLNSSAAYQKLWNLQEGLENHRSVGSIISLPVLMAEAKQAPFAFFLFWDWLLDILEKPQYGKVAKSFVTNDRQYGLFLLRMNELNRVQKRLDIIEELTNIVTAHGFKLEITGGVYKLQGHLSLLVAKSLISGLGKLLLLFTIIAWIVSRSVKISIAMMASLVLIPVGILGAIGIYRIPLDVVSSPASNVAIAMGIDSMIHMIKAYRRKRKKDKSDPKEIWQAVRNELWQPILTSMIVVNTGFAIFLFSTFPPTQRFGGAIVFGSILAALTALYILPYFAMIKFKKPQEE